MNVQLKKAAAMILFAAGLTGTAFAQIGKPFIHDPSTIMFCEGKYYTFGTRGGGLISEEVIVTGYLILRYWDIWGEVEG